MVGAGNVASMWAAKQIGHFWGGPIFTINGGDDIVKFSSVSLCVKTKNSISELSMIYVYAHLLLLPITPSSAVCRGLICRIVVLN